MKLLQRATEIEESMNLTFGPPLVVKSSHELFGETFLELGRAEQALAMFERALERAPRRTAALVGLLQASRRIGDPETSQEVAKALRSIWRSSDPSAERALLLDPPPEMALWGDLEPGPHAVGFTVFNEHRPASSDGPEPHKEGPFPLVVIAQGFPRPLLSTFHPLGIPGQPRLRSVI